MSRAIKRRVAALENLRAETERAQDPENHPMMELSPEERELLRRHREASERGEDPEYTPEFEAALRHYTAAMRRRLNAEGRRPPSPGESEQIIAILRSARTRGTAGG
jgi:hypothetical protein